jgi:predicted alpha/beta superfamily hydrolase
VFINDSIMGIVGSEMKFKRIDNGVPRKLQGAWLMSGRIRDGDGIINLAETKNLSRIETFTFSSNGTTTKGKIFLPASYETNKNLSAIFLIDYTEQHFKLATDEFEKVIDGVKQIQSFDALVVTLEEHLDIDAKPKASQEYYDVFKNMTSYVDGNYTNNTSRTFIGRGSESGIVLMTLFLENSETSVFDNFIVTDPSPVFTDAVINMIENEDFPKNKRNKKLHFSFSTSNNREKCTKLINLINDVQYPWLKFESLEYATSDYENTYPVSFAAGIKYIFNK